MSFQSLSSKPLPFQTHSKKVLICASVRASISLTSIPPSVLRAALGGVGRLKSPVLQDGAGVVVIIRMREEDRNFGQHSVPAFLDAVIGIDVALAEREIHRCGEPSRGGAGQFARRHRFRSHWAASASAFAALLLRTRAIRYCP